MAGTARITEIDAVLSANVTDDPLTDLVNAPDPVQTWADTPLANKRIIIDRLCTVTILPTNDAAGAASTQPLSASMRNTRSAPSSPERQDSR
jgi:hypothetical protein